MTNIKDLKRELRELKKIKKECRSGTKERIELHHKIKLLKEQLLKIPEEIKTPIDTKIYKKIYYTGFISRDTIEKLKYKFGIEFIDKCSLINLEA
ncbi:MAG: hypothetical protein V1901_04060 [Patescibacteria group bacterium]